METTPPPTLVINDLETLRVISDPLRLKIFRAAGEFTQRGELCSVKQISGQVGIPPAKLYYHIRLLETAGLLDAAETRLVSGIQEKLYRVPALRIYLAAELLSGEIKQDTLYPMFAGMINEVMGEVQQALSAPESGQQGSGLSFSRLTLRLPRNRIADLTQKLEEFARELEQGESSSADDAAEFTFFYTLYPQPGTDRPENNPALQ
jgi:DNA-binding transcriptional ArsR family regulator